MRSRLYVLLALVMAAALWVGFRPHTFWSHWSWVNEPVHSTVEAVGGMAALFLAVILLQGDADGGRRFLPGIGLLGMGLLDIFHAATTPGHGFVLLRCTATLVGGFWFSLVWLREPPPRVRKALPWLVAAASILFGIYTPLFRETLPLMVIDGKFTGSATAITVLGGALFLVAALRFLLDFHRSADLDTYLLACVAALFGLAGLLFTRSALWDDAWWFWHFLRLVAYLLALWFAIRRQRRTAETLRTTTVSRDELAREIEQRRQAEEDLRRLSVSRALVGEMQRDLQVAGGLSQGAMFRAGRQLAGRVEADTLEGFLDAFSALGLGTLALAATDESRHRWTLSGNGLVENEAGSRQPTCDFTRGFLCGAVARVGGVGTASAEVACQSMGDQLCRFVVQAVGSDERATAVREGASA